MVEVADLQINVEAENAQAGACCCAHAASCLLWWIVLPAAAANRRETCGPFEARVCEPWPLQVASA